MDSSNWTYCTLLQSSLLESIDRRFEILKFSSPESDNAVIAALSYPLFKNRWFSCVDSSLHSRFISLFKNVVATYSELDKENQVLGESDGENDNFFDFGPPTTTSGYNTNTSSEIEVGTKLYIIIPNT